jgi:hypothetical protein
VKTATAIASPTSGVSSISPNLSYTAIVMDNLAVRGITREAWPPPNPHEYHGGSQASSSDVAGSYLNDVHGTYTLN